MKHSIGKIRAAIIVLGALCGTAAATTQTVIILHDNDIHGHLRSFCYVEKARGGESRCEVGGAARRATLVKKLRAHADAPVLLVDAGDTTTRGPLATSYEGVDEIEAMNQMGYDMATVGNNEFKLKDGSDEQDAAGAQAAFERLVRRARFPWLCANATDSNGALLAGVQPFIVRSIGSLRIAFLGLTAPRSGKYPQTRGLLIGDPIAAAKAWIPRARAEADIVIAVTHLGVEDDQRLVGATRGIDAVIGGDSHTFLYEPLVTKNMDGVDVPIVQDGEFGVRLGELRLSMTGSAAEGWHIDRFADRLIPVDALLKPDPAIAALVESYAHPFDIRVGTVAAAGATAADRRRMTSEALANAWKSAAGVDVGLEREIDVYDSFDRLDVTRYVVHAVLPFHETVWRGEMTGERLKQILDTPTDFGGAMRATIRDEDIDPARIYSVATTTFTAKTVLPGGFDTGQDSWRATEIWFGATRAR